MAVEPFIKVLKDRGVTLSRERTTTLQINVGLLCNQSCRHCHQEAGPNCGTVMDRMTAGQVVDYAGRGGFDTIDITGGAPELNPHLRYLIERVAPLVPRVMMRSNLTALSAPARAFILDLCKEHRVVLVASLPSLNESQTESQRGSGVFGKSIEMLQTLNSLGYGQDGTGLEVHLAANPSGAFLPVGQAQAEKKYRLDLSRKWGIVFNDLYMFTNVPLGRFRHWLLASGNFDSYMNKLARAFNPCTLSGLMCRSLVSVAWDGFLYDCDFNLAGGLPMGGRRTHISRATGPPRPGSPIAISDHCYACTAGSGFT